MKRTEIWTPQATNEQSTQQRVVPNKVQPRIKVRPLQNNKQRVSRRISISRLEEKSKRKSKLTRYNPELCSPVRIHAVLHHLATQSVLPGTQSFRYYSKLSDVWVPIVPPAVEASFRIDTVVDPAFNRAESVVCCSCSQVVDLDLREEKKNGEISFGEETGGKRRGETRGRDDEPFLL